MLCVCVTDYSLATSDFLSYFECPVCTDLMTSQVYQCARGHLVCGRCWARLPTCPTCRGPRQEIRNLALEQMVERLRFPCGHANYGCSETVSLAVRASHEVACSYRPYACPLPGAQCRWQGSLADMNKHLTVDHTNVGQFLGHEVVFNISGATFPAPSSWVLLQRCWGRDFLATVETDDGNDFRAFVQIIADPEEAAAFTYKLQLGLPPRTLTWQSTPRNLRATENLDYFSIDTRTVDMFLENTNLPLLINIEPLSIDELLSR